MAQGENEKGRRKKTEKLLLLHDILTGSATGIGSCVFTTVMGMPAGCDVEGAPSDPIGATAAFFCDQTDSFAQHMQQSTIANANW
eukprot:3726052-Rhodomonas_salina.1